MPGGRLLPRAQDGSPAFRLKELCGVCSVRVRVVVGREGARPGHRRRTLLDRLQLEGAIAAAARQLPVVGFPEVELVLLRLEEAGGGARRASPFVLLAPGAARVCWA